jgi:hypothetical protein
METDNVLLVVAVIAVIVSLVGAGLTYSYINAFKSKMTGFATTAGWINLTVEESASVNFTYYNVNWGSGRVASGKENATMDTSNQSAENVTNGNFTGNTNGLVIENIGNKNVTLNLTVTSDAVTMIGGSASGGPVLKWRLSDNETGSCSFNDTTFYKDLWRDVNTTTQLICDKLNADNNKDTLKINLYAVVPSDSFTGARGNTITATFSAI